MLLNIPRFGLMHLDVPQLRQMTGDRSSFLWYNQPKIPHLMGAYKFFYSKIMYDIKEWMLISIVNSQRLRIGGFKSSIKAYDYWDTNTFWQADIAPHKLYFSRYFSCDSPVHSSHPSGIGALVVASVWAFLGSTVIERK